ncbi:MAG: hypothetical protein CMJ32_00005 [Phycisphaerae bacterium]|nr:hypothetical protein [Phycisphaerae bacterium]
MKPIRVIPPVELPVTVDDVRAQARIDYADDDVLLDGMISSAVELLDGYGGLLGRAIMAQTWRVPVEKWFTELVLPMPAVRDVSVTYQDAEGATQTAPSEWFEVTEEHRGPVVRRRKAFTDPALYDDAAYPISVTWTAGAEGPSSVDRRVKLAITMLVSHWDMNRAVTAEERLTQVPWGIDALIAPLRWRSV